MVLFVALAASSVAMGDTIQVTLSDSLSGSVNLSTNGSTGSFSFISLSGHAYLEPAGTSGKYWLWSTGGTPTLSEVSGDTYSIDLGTAKVYLDVKLGPHGNGSQGELSGTLALTTLIGASTPAPQFQGYFTPTLSTGAFSGAFQIGVPEWTDITKKSPKGISSGEVVPAPEPTSLVLLGSGFLGLYGFVRRTTKL